MNSTSIQPEPNEEPWNGFEQKLRSRSLGAAPQNRGELMYQCGYAAGVSATRKQVHRTTMGWRVVGLAASMLACISLASHFYPMDIQGEKQLGMKEQPNPLPPKQAYSVPNTTSDSWIAHLTRERRAESLTTGVLRASEKELHQSEAMDLGLESKSVGPGFSGDTLRPGDFPLFL